MQHTGNGDRGREEGHTSRADGRRVPEAEVTENTRLLVSPGTWELGTRTYEESSFSDTEEDTTGDEPLIALDGSGTAGDWASASAQILEA